MTRHNPQFRSSTPPRGTVTRSLLGPPEHRAPFDVPGSELASLAAETDWSAGPLGEPGAWPQSLRTTVGICLSSRFPILLWWGPELAMVYNDAYRPMLGETKHPQALGRPGREVWSEIWDVIGPMLDQVMRGEGATWSDDQLFVLERNGYPEECFFTFSHSPIPDESDQVAGVFTAVTETTERVVAQRRLATLAALAGIRGIGRRPDVLRAAGEILGANTGDHPAVVVLDTPPEGDRAALSEAVGAQLDRFGAATRARVSDLVRQVSAEGGPLRLPADDESRAAGVQAWHAYPLGEQASLAEHGVAVVVVGESVHRRWDDSLEEYVALCATHVSAAADLADREQHLRRAIESHEEIGQAVGILVERHRWSPAVAFEHLKRSSQDHNTKLREVARQVIESGADPG